MAKDVKKDSHRSSFLLTSKNCRKTSYEMMYFDHIEAMTKYCIDCVQIFQFASEDITRIIKSRFLGKQNAVPWDEGSRHRGIVQESLQLLWSRSAPQLQSTHPWKSNQMALAPLVHLSGKRFQIEQRLTRTHPLWIAVEPWQPKVLIAESEAVSMFLLLLGGGGLYPMHFGKNCSALESSLMGEAELRMRAST
jgi:hypothetical protein